MTPTFSIIMPAYNNLRLFLKALDSILTQEEVTFNIFVVDDSTNDEIENYIHNINDIRINYTHNKPSLGAVKNWNSGLRKINGENIIILHHDESFAYNHALNDIRKEISSADIVISNVCVTNKGNKYILTPNWIRKTLKFLPSTLFIANTIGPCACIAFKSKQIIFFDENLKWFVDTDWYYRLIANNTVYISNTIRINSEHGHKGQITKNININNEAKQDYNFLKRKYKHNLIIKVFMFSNIFIIHNNKINKLIHKIIRRNKEEN